MQTISFGENMLEIGSKITGLQKRKNWSPSYSAVTAGAFWGIIGKYKFNENNPTGDRALKIAKLFNVRLGYELWGGKQTSFDKEPVDRFHEIAALNKGTCVILFNCGILK